MADLISSKTNEITIFEFSLGDNNYGINADFITEIHEYEENTPVPNTPEVIEGVIISRGDVVVNVNMYKYLNLECSDDKNYIKNIIIKYGNSYIGLIVGTVNGLHNIDVSSIEKADDNQEKFVLGTINVNGKAISLLDIRKVLLSINESI